MAGSAWLPLVLRLRLHLLAAGVESAYFLLQSLGGLGGVDLLPGFL